MFRNRYRLMKPEGDDATGGGGTAGDTAATGATGAEGATGGSAVTGTPAAKGAAATGTDQGAKGSAAAPGAAATSTEAGAGGEAKGYWPADWQQKTANGDDKRLKAISRYASPEAMADALIAAQNRIRSGELKTALPKDAKPEELAAWRVENGIPESPDKYDLTFNNGLVIGEADKPVVDGFLKTAHTNNLPPEAVKSTIEWYYQEQERQIEERQTMDAQQKQAAQDALNAEWGTNYRQNVQAINGVLEKFPENVRGLLASGRLGDNTGIFNNVDVLRGFAALALEINPAATLVPSGSGDPMKGIDGRLDEINKFMAKDRAAYNKDEKMQQEYRDLITARDKLAKRG